MCELYVAVTRAKRRVVILYKTGQIKKTLQGCNIEESDAEAALLEFDSGTTTDAWFKRGMELFEDEQYKMAASCFKAAGESKCQLSIPFKSIIIWRLPQFDFTFHQIILVTLSIQMAC